MLAVHAILTSRLLFALSCLLFFLILITIYILRRPGMSLLTLNHRRRWKEAAPPPLHLSSQKRQQDLESNPFDPSPSPSPSPTSTSSLDSPAFYGQDSAMSSGSLYSETFSATTTPITWRDPWRWRFAESRRSGSGNGSGGEVDDGDVERRIITGSVESPGLSPLGLDKYFFEGGVGIRDM